MIATAKIIGAILTLAWMNGQCLAWLPTTVNNVAIARTNTALTAAQTDSHSSRRDVLATGFFTAAGVTMAFAPQAAFAASDEEPVYYNPAEVQKAFDAIRYQLEDPDGGVAYLQACVDKVDYEALFEFTKTYDLEFRKAKMSLAKKKFKMGGDLPTQLCNNVTFDLIGMNKSCRKGQENIALTQKYLNELKTDVSKFLELKSTILVESS